METLNSMLYLLSYNSKVTTHALGVLSSYYYSINMNLYHYYVTLE